MPLILYWDPSDNTVKSCPYKMFFDLFNLPDARWIQRCLAQTYFVGPLRRTGPILDCIVQRACFLMQDVSKFLKDLFHKVLPRCMPKRARVNEIDFYKRSKEELAAIRQEAPNPLCCGCQQVYTPREMRNQRLDPSQPYCANVECIHFAMQFRRPEDGKVRGNPYVRIYVLWALVMYHLQYARTWKEGRWKVERPSPETYLRNQKQRRNAKQPRARRNGNPTTLPAFSKLQPLREAFWKYDDLLACAFTYLLPSGVAGPQHPAFSELSLTERGKQVVVVCNILAHHVEVQVITKPAEHSRGRDNPAELKEVIQRFQLDQRFVFAMAWLCVKWRILLKMQREAPRLGRKMKDMAIANQPGVRKGAACDFWIALAKDYLAALKNEPHGQPEKHSLLAALRRAVRQPQAQIPFAPAFWLAFRAKMEALDTFLGGPLLFLTVSPTFRHTSSAYASLLKLNAQAKGRMERNLLTASMVYKKSMEEEVVRSYLRVLGGPFCAVTEAETARHMHVLVYALDINHGGVSLEQRFDVVLLAIAAQRMLEFRFVRLGLPRRPTRPTKLYRMGIQGCCGAPQSHE